MNAVRDHAVGLARSSITEELVALQQESANCDELTKKQKKEHILTRLKRLVPGSTPGLNAMIDEDGKVTAEPAGVASILRKHWAKTFTHRNIDRAKLDRWLDESGTKGDMGKPIAGWSEPRGGRWAVSKGEVRKAIKLAGNTMPGPDQIPYKAWKRTQRIGCHDASRCHGRALQYWFHRGAPEDI